MKARTNSPIDDPAPFDMPQFEELEDEQPTAVSGMNKKGVDEYINGRIGYFEKYLPNGTPIIDLTDEEAGRWWKMAATLKAEFQALNNYIQGDRNEPPAPRV